MTFKCKSIANVDRQGNPVFSEHHQVEIYLHESEQVQASLTLWCDPSTGHAGGLLVEPLVAALTGATRTQLMTATVQRKEIHKVLKEDLGFVLDAVMDVEQHGIRQIGCQQLVARLGAARPDDAVTVARQRALQHLVEMHLVQRRLRVRERTVRDGHLDAQQLGYRAQLQGKNIQLALGYSHPVIFPLPDGVTAEVGRMQVGKA